MLLLKQTSTKAFVVGVLLTCVVMFATEYHQPDLFPIGFSGFSNVGYSAWEEPFNTDGSPYYDTATYGTWAKEKDLLVDSAGANFIGCSDAWFNSYIAFSSPDKKDFYNKVCALDKNITLNYNLCKSKTL